MLTDLLRSVCARLVSAPKARGRHGTPAGPFRPAIEPLDERSLPSTLPVVHSLAAANPQPGHFELLRAYQQRHHLGPLYAALPDFGAGQTAAPNTFVGQIAGTNIFVAVVVGPREALAYACDGMGGVREWLRGPVQGSTLSLSGTARSAKGDQITAQVQGDAVSGTLTLRGVALPFTADRAADGRSGLFRAVVRPGRQVQVGTDIRIGDHERGSAKKTRLANLIGAA
jgi:hypothetical protein